MTSFHLAQLNIARWAVDPDGPVAQTFIDQLDEVNGLGEASPGFVWRLKEASGDATQITTPWGPDWIANLSVWDDISSLRAYAFGGRHRTAFKQRRSWFAEHDEPTSVLWWVPVGHEPTLAEAEQRLAMLRREGPSPDAFTFARPYPAPEVAEAAEVDDAAVPVVVVRTGTGADLPAVAAIYTHYVLNTTTTFHTQMRTPLEWRDRYREHVVEGPYELLVAEVDGVVIGYCETLPFRPKPAYFTSIELSIYVAPGVVGGGVGHALLSALFTRLEGGPFHRLFSIITLPNEASVGFHERHGFVHRGTLTEAGHKFDRFLDVAYFERAL